MLSKFNSDWENTNWGFVIFLAAAILPAVGVILHCLFNISQGRALEAYNLIIMGHPVLTNLGATYLEVLIGDIITLLALIIGLFLRHRYYSDERDFIKKYNIKSKSGFTRDFKGPSGSQSSHYDSDYDD